jgi:hypothetical protein
MNNNMIKNDEHYTRDDHFHDLICKIKYYVEKYKDTENLEIEFRIGYIQENEFKTDIGKDFFDKIYDGLNNSNAWDDVKTEKSEDFFFNGKRMTVINNQVKYIKKEKLAIFDYIFKGSGFDIRISFSKETPIKQFTEIAKFKRSKDRCSLSRGHLSYDLTKVKMEDNGVEDHLFEIELEIKELNLKKMTSHYIIHDAMMKITDMIELCEVIDDDYKLEFVKEKIY